jgi:hypothetical protein
MYLQKVVLKKFVGVLKVTDVNRRIRIRKSEVRFRGSGSVPKSHGSVTLKKDKNFTDLDSVKSMGPDRQRGQRFTSCQKNPIQRIL